VLVASGFILAPALVLIAAAAVCVLLSQKVVGWFTPSPQSLRSGEQELIEEMKRP